MNSVHEPCPNGDSETVLSRKTGWVHQVHSLLAQQHAQVRTGRAPVPNAPRAQPARPARPACTPCTPSPVPSAQRPAQRPAKPAASVTIQILYRDTAFFPANCPLYCNTIPCIATQIHPHSATIQEVYCKTIFFPTNYTPLQYNLLYCNTTPNQA